MARIHRPVSPVLDRVAIQSTFVPSAVSSVANVAVFRERLPVSVSIFSVLNSPCRLPRSGIATVDRPNRA